MKIKKSTKITQDKTQTRSTIPNKFVKIMEVSNKDRIKWTLDEKRKELTGELVKDDNTNN